MLSLQHSQHTHTSHSVRQLRKSVLETKREREREREREKPHRCVLLSSSELLERLGVALGAPLCAIHHSIKALLRLYEFTITALLRLYESTITALLRRYYAALCYSAHIEAAYSRSIYTSTRT